MPLFLPVDLRSYFLENSNSLSWQITKLWKNVVCILQVGHGGLYSLTFLYSGRLILCWRGLKNLCNQENRTEELESDFQGNVVRETVTFISALFLYPLWEKPVAMPWGYLSRPTDARREELRLPANIQGGNENSCQSFCHWHLGSRSSGPSEVAKWLQSWQHLDWNPSRDPDSEPPC
jgi:hypothetical protein